MLKQGIESAQDILYAGLSVLTELLVESLPYDGKDPLQVSAAEKAGTGAEWGREGGRDAGREGGLHARSKEASRGMCERLAKKIVMR